MFGQEVSMVRRSTRVEHRNQHDNRELPRQRILDSGNRRILERLRRDLLKELHSQSRRSQTTTG